MNPHEHNGQIISLRNLLNESNSIPRIIFLNERKRPESNFSLFALWALSLCLTPPPITRRAKSIDWRRAVEFLQANCKFETRIELNKKKEGGEEGG